MTVATPALRILVAEDNPVNQKVVTKMLERLGHCVVLADNGAFAVREVTQGPFDLVLMDCMMPVMNGFQATGVIRRLPSGAGLPIVAVTANASEGDRERCLRAGMDDHLPKPIRLQSLREMIDSLVERGLVQHRHSA